MENNEKKELFWADQLAKKIIGREKFRYVEKKIPEFSEYVVKTSASISGVLHIGRLSDTIRGASVHRALLDAGVKSSLIWVAEDMDPLRKIPKGVPETFEEYIGMPVSIVPDPDGCHKSYAEHHTDDYFKVLGDFTFEKMQRFSMQDEYRKGSFNEFIRKILKKIDAVKEIQDKYRTNQLKKEWSPWAPVCKNCRKIVTPKVRFDISGGISYACTDYVFETTIAKGCGYKGEADPLKDEGKLVWKSEWAAQWAKWQISTEGAGKEYQVPNSAFWINAEIVERVLDFPSPEPIFYEHLFIDGVKMSASLGNVIYPKDWLQVATPQLLRFFYNKRLMMARSFSWKELPQLYDEYDKAAAIYFDKMKLENEKEESHIKRMYELSNRKGNLDKPLEMTFPHATMLAQTFTEPKGVLASLKKTKQYDKEMEEEIMARVAKAAEWVKLHAPPEYKFEVKTSVAESVKKKLSQQQAKALKKLAETLKSKEWTEKDLFNEIYGIIKSEKIQPAEFFQACYLVLLGSERGPRLAPFLITLGEKAVALLESV